MLLDVMVIVALKGSGEKLHCIHPPGGNSKIFREMNLQRLQLRRNRRQVWGDQNHLNFMQENPEKLGIIERKIVR